MLKRLFNTKFTAAQVVVSATVLSVALLLAPSMASAADLVSVNNAGKDSGNGASLRPVISADGRFVVFASDASDLVPTDTNDTTDIFVRDLENGITDLVSINSAGTGSGKGSSGSPAISPDGRFMAFVSFATDLVAPETNGKRHIFVRDRDTGMTTLVSVNSAGIQGDANSSSPVISADGRFVAFASEASNLVSGDTNDNTDVFVRDLDTGMTTLVSVTSAGASGDNLSLSPVINADGQFVAFVSFASNLVSTKTNGKAHIFVRDLQAGPTEATTLVSVNISGTSGNGFSGSPVISADGQFVAFQSSANDLVAKDTNVDRDVFVRDLRTGTTTLVSVSGTDSGKGRSDSPVISADGQFVAFRSFATDLAATDTNGATDVFVRDLQNETTTLVSVNSSGADSGNGSSEAPAISADGKVVAFRSFASNLVRTDNNGAADVFVSVLGQEESAVALIIDEDSIDNGNFFAAADINDHIAQIGLRTQLPFFADNVGQTITLHTGQMGDEGWFALKTIPQSWGGVEDGLRNFVGQPSQPFPRNIGKGLGRGSDPEALLDKIPDVTPLRATGLKLLKGRNVCAVVYDSDISINYAPLNGRLNGSLKGATLGTVAFEVMSVTELTGFSSSSLPQVEIKILDSEDVCTGQLEVFSDAPEPMSGSEPFDVKP